MRLIHFIACRPLIVLLVALLTLPSLLYSQIQRQYKFTPGEATPGLVLKSFETTPANTILTLEYDMKQMTEESKFLTISKKTSLVSKTSKNKYKIIKSSFVPLCPKKYTNEFKDNVIVFKLYFPLIDDKAGKNFELVEEDGCNPAQKGGLRISDIQISDFVELHEPDYYINNPDKIVKIKKIRQQVFVTAVCKILKSAINDDFKSVTGQVKGSNDQVAQCFSTVGMPTCKPQNNIVAIYGNGKKQYYGAFWKQKDSSVDFSIYMMDSLKTLLEQVLKADYTVLDVEASAYEKMYVFARKDDNKAADKESNESQFPNITIGLLRNKNNVAIMIGKTLFSYEKKEGEK